MKLRHAAAFTLGCGAVLMRPDAWPLWTALPILLLALWRPMRGTALALVLGATLCEWQVRLQLEDQWPEARHGEVHTVTGWVSSLPESLPAQAGTQWRFQVESDAAAQAAGIPRRLRVSWYDGPETLEAGSCWQFTLRLRTPRGSHNPGSFDYEGWLFRERLGATAAVRSAEPCLSADTEGWRAAVLRQRAAWVDRLDQLLGDHPGKAYLAALGVGDGRGLSREHWEVFRKTGTSHLVVISGLHLGLITGVGFVLLRLLWPLWPAAALRMPTPLASGVGAALLATVYALLAGFEPPVIRALLMVWLGLWLAWRGGWRQPLRALALIWIVVVAWDPLRLLRPGLWLSFIAVGAIVYLLAFRWKPALGWRQFLWLQLALGVVMVPLTLGFFSGASLMAPLANLIAVPLFLLLTPAALLAGVLTLIDSVWVHHAVHALASAFVWVDVGLRYLVEVGEFAWWQHRPNVAASVMALMGAFLLLAPRGLPGSRGLGLLCMLPLLLPPPEDSSPLTLTVLDVGQGLAVVARTPNHALVYDAGPAWPGGFDAGDAVVVPYLQFRGVSDVDRVVVSHAHQDHEGGVDAVMAAFPGAERMGANSPVPCIAGQRWRWDAVDFEVLHPPEGTFLASSRVNEQSCVIRLQVGDQSVLLTGDIEALSEAWLRRSGVPLSADLLLAPHHGSRTSSTGAFIDAVNPRVVVFSAGWRHHFGHPHANVVERYMRRDIQRWSTAEHGALTWQLDGVGALPEPLAWRLSHRRRWHATATP